MLKQIISISALTAASAICANAEEIFLYNYNTATNKSLAENGWSKIGAYDTQNASYIGSYDGMTQEWQASGVTPEKVEGWRFVDGVGASSVGASYDISSYLTGDLTDYSVTFKMQLDSPAYFSDGKNGSSAYYKTAGREGFIIGVAGYAAKFSYDGNNLKVGETTFEGLDFNAIFEATIDVTATGASLVINDTRTSLEKKFEPDSWSSLVKIGTFDSDASFGGATVNSVVLSIPEPSLFGLLAGLGALALVGTRRRRK